MEKQFLPYERPLANRHCEIERQMHEYDKRLFGGVFYSDGARKFNINVMDS